jgi:hypothetical protein
MISKSLIFGTICVVYHGCSDAAPNSVPETPNKLRRTVQHDGPTLLHKDFSIHEDDHDGFRADKFAQVNQRDTQAGAIATSAATPKQSMQTKAKPKRKEVVKADDENSGEDGEEKDSEKSGSIFSRAWNNASNFFRRKKGGKANKSPRKQDDNSNTVIDSN